MCMDSGTLIVDFGSAMVTFLTETAPLTTSHSNAIFVLPHIPVPISSIVRATAVAFAGTPSGVCIQNTPAAIR